MGFDPLELEWYCQPVKDGVWSHVVENAFGTYTPCAIDTLVVYCPVVVRSELASKCDFYKPFSLGRLQAS